MTVRRLDSVGLVVEDLDATIDFFLDLGLELEDRGVVEGEFVDDTIGLEGARSEIARLRTPDGHGRLEVSRFLAPTAIRRPDAPAPVNALGVGRIMFEVDDIDATVARLQARGATLVGRIARYEDVYRLCYLRGPEGILVALAEDLR
jgi:catechol 2,3-dioxygenase-like lactoylglutathione lyase family enzyme